MEAAIFWLVLVVGIAGLAVYRKISPDTFWLYFAWVMVIEFINGLLFWPF